MKSTGMSKISQTREKKNWVLLFFKVFNFSVMGMDREAFSMSVSQDRISQDQGHDTWVLEGRFQLWEWMTTASCTGENGYMRLDQDAEYPQAPEMRADTEFCRKKISKQRGKQNI